MAKPRLGWIGTGVIGGACARRALDAGYELVVTSRTKSKATPLLDAGARWEETPRLVAENADVVFSTVGTPKDVREIFFGDEGVLAAWRNYSSPSAPKTYVDSTTSSPELAQEIARAARENGFDALDAPVSGGDVGARNGTLSIMIGGAASVVERLRDVFAVFGTNVRHAGEPGAGQRTKMANQILIAGNMIGVCESLLYAYRAGLDLENVLASVSTGAAGSWSLSNLAPRILKGDYQPGFFVEHFVKDMTIALEDASKMELALPGLALVRQLYLALIAQGGAKLGTQALIKALATLSNIDRFK
jgi:3-hydroxyisobutyrate dehydrogenase